MAKITAKNKMNLGGIALFRTVIMAFLIRRYGAGLLEEERSSEC